MAVAKRRRPVERTRKREALIGRFVLVVVSLLVLSAVMTLLPPSSQRSFVRVICTVASLGLTDCTPPPAVAADLDLGTAQCSALAAVDTAYPLVSTSRISLEGGLRLDRYVARDGSVVITPSRDSTERTEDVWSGEGSVEPVVVAEGVSVPPGSGWLLPSGTGEDELIDLLRQAHQQYVQARSPLALFASADTSLAPPPNRLSTTVPVASFAFPGAQSTGGAATTGASSGEAGSNGAAKPSEPGHRLVLDRDRPATLVVNSLQRTTTTSVSLVDSVSAPAGNAGLVGTLTSVRRQDGTLSRVAFSAAGQMFDAASEGRSTEVVYGWMDLDTPADSATADAWLSAPGGVSLDIDWLVRAGSVPDSPLARLVNTSMTVVAVTVAKGGEGARFLAENVQHQAVNLRRGPEALEGATAVRLISPEPGTTPRQIRTQSACVVPR